MCRVACSHKQLFTCSFLRMRRKISDVCNAINIEHRAHGQVQFTLVPFCSCFVKDISNLHGGHVIGVICYFPCYLMCEHSTMLVACYFLIILTLLFALLVRFTNTHTRIITLGIQNVTASFVLSVLQRKNARFRELHLQSPGGVFRPLPPHPLQQLLALFASDPSSFALNSLSRRLTSGCVPPRSHYRQPFRLAFYSRRVLVLHPVAGE